MPSRLEILPLDLGVPRCDRRDVFQTEDNAQSNRSKITRAFFLSRMLVVGRLLWPACSPDLNPVDSS